MPKTAKSVIIELMRRLLLIITAIIFLSGDPYLYPAEPHPRPTLEIHDPEAAYRITGRDYFPEVLKLIRQAQKSIYITMYIATYHPDYPNTPSNQLLQELVNAHKRGVKVRVILEQCRVYSAKSQYNDLCYLFLKDAGIQVDYDTISTKLHDKLIIIDERIIIIGSHNWSKSALDENRETSAVIISPGLAREYIKWIESTPLSPRYTPPPSAETASVYIPYRFLTDPKVGSELMRRNSKRTFDLYLYLLSKWQGQPLSLNYDEIGELFGVKDKWKPVAVRGLINARLLVLDKTFGLIKRKRDSKKEPLQITLIDYKDRRQRLTLEPQECFIVPGGFWEFGWLERLSMAAKYFYFISLIETKLSLEPEGYWSHSQEHLHKKYHLGPTALSGGVLELSRYNLLEVQYGPLIYPFEKYLRAPRYRLLPLYSWIWHEEEINKLKELYGKDKVAKAIKWAEIVQDENNLEVIEKLINYADEYGEEAVQYAVDKVAEKRIANPKRSFAYIEGIILKGYRDMQEETEE